MARQYSLMSADGHLEVPPERWVHRVPEKYRDRAPRTVHLPDGGDAQLIEGQPLLEANFLDLRAGRAEGTWQPFGLKVADAAGTGSPEQRIKEQDQDGLDAEVLFPAMVAGPVFWRNISHDEVYKAVIRGYNDWLAEEYCAVAPDRLIGMGVMPITNVDDAIAEMTHCKKLGLKGVQLGALPSGKGYPTPEDDKFWAAALDMEMPVTVHVAFNRTGARVSQPTFRYPKEIPEIMQRLRRPFLEWICNFGQPPAISVAQLVLAGVFERFPKLKIYFAETRLGAAPRITIGVGLVEERDTEVERFVDDLTGCGEIDAAAKVVTAKADNRDLQTRLSEISLFHASSGGERREDFFQCDQLVAVDRVGHEHRRVETGSVPFPEPVANFSGRAIK